MESLMNEFFGCSDSLELFHNTDSRDSICFYIQNEDGWGEIRKLWKNKRADGSRSAGMLLFHIKVDRRIKRKRDDKLSWRLPCCDNSSDKWIWQSLKKVKLWEIILKWRMADNSALALCDAWVQAKEGRKPCSASRERRKRKCWKVSCHTRRIKPEDLRVVISHRERVRSPYIAHDTPPFWE